MKRLSMSLPAMALALVLALSGAAFVPTPTTVTSTIRANPIDKTRPSAPAPLITKRFDIDYYWFTVPDDQFFDQQTLYNEEFELMQFYYPDNIIDTNPMGGTLIEKGYTNPNQPHLGYPDVYLYAH